MSNMRTCKHCKGTGRDPMSDVTNWLPCHPCHGVGQVYVGKPDGVVSGPEPYAEGLPPHVRTSDTSRAAAVSVADSTVSMQQRIVDYIKTRGAAGATCDEVEIDLDLKHQSASACIRTLVKKGHLFDSGQRRLTRSGRQAAIWWTK